jgi:hypothetical protein
LIFSALNNLNDITLSAKYVPVCGDPQQELESSFAEYIDEVADQTDMTGEDFLTPTDYLVVPYLLHNNLFSTAIISLKVRSNYIFGIVNLIWTTHYLISSLVNLAIFQS